MVMVNHVFYCHVTSPFEIYNKQGNRAPPAPCRDKDGDESLEIKKFVRGFISQEFFHLQTHLFL